MDQQERKSCAEIVLSRLFRNLEEEDFKKSKFLLDYYSLRDGQPDISRRHLEKAESTDIANLLIAHCGDKIALEIAINLLNDIPRDDLLEKFQIAVKSCFGKGRTLSKAEIEESKNKYKRYLKKCFGGMKTRHCRIGERMILNEHYTRLLVMKRYRQEEEKKNEILFSGTRHLELMAQWAENSYSSIEALFDPGEDGRIPSTIVLQGMPGIGKTMLSRKIMLDWAVGELFQDRFKYVFYINCREHDLLNGQQNIEDLVVHSCGGESILSMRDIESDPTKLLFIIDGFDELQIPNHLQPYDPTRNSKRDKTMISLISGRYLLGSSILITTRPTSLEILRQFVTGGRFAEILGFSERDREEYFTKFFENKSQGKQVCSLVRENHILFTMCFVPISCWTVCRAIKQQLELEDEVNSACTTTSIYMLFISSLLFDQSRESLHLTINMNLKRLCALAKEGIYEQKTLFEDSDLAKHSIDVSAIQSLFLKKDIFQKDDENYNVYSFMHVSVQEFFAAMFYVLGENHAAPEYRENSQRDVIRLLDDYWNNKHIHLMLTVHFLFGLLNNDKMHMIERQFKWKISPDVRLVLLEWSKGALQRGGSEITDQQMELFHFLYEIQDDKFVKSATETLEAIEVSSQSLKRKINGTDCRELAFCLKNSQGVQNIHFRELEMRPDFLNMLTQGLKKCSILRMESCSLTDSCCADLSSVIKTNSSLTELDLSCNNLKNSGVRELCEGLKHPRCKVQTLRIENCSLTGSCCTDLSFVLKTNTSLIELDQKSRQRDGFGMREPYEERNHSEYKIQKMRAENAFTDSCFADLSSVLKRNLPFADLDSYSYKLDGYGMREQYEGRKHSGYKSQKMGMWHRSFKGSHWDDPPPVPRPNTSLTSLILSSNELEDSGVRELCNALKYPGCRLKTLGLDGCSLTGSCCADLASVLGTNTLLTELNLGHNKLGDSGVGELCDGLKHPDCKIQTLGLRHTSLTDACTGALCSALKTNRTLRHLDLGDNSFTRKSEASFKRLKENCAALELCIQYCS